MCQISDPPSLTGTPQRPRGVLVAGDRDVGVVVELDMPRPPTRGMCGNRLASMIRSVVRSVGDQLAGPSGVLAQSYAPA